MEMTVLNLIREWLISAQRIRDAIVSFIIADISIRERELKQHADEARREALKRKIDQIEEESKTN